MVVLELFVGFLMDFHDSPMVFLEFSHFPMLALWCSYDLHDFLMVFLWLLWFSYRVAMLSFEYDMIWLLLSYGFPFVFLSVPMVFLWSSFGSPMVFHMVLLGIPMEFL